MKVYHAAYAISLYCLADSCDVFFCCCQWFLDQDIFLCICHSACNISMCEVRCYDCNCIDLLVSYHIMIICIYFADSEFIRNLSCSCFVHITDCYRICKKMFCIDRRMCTSPCTSSYNTHSDLFNFHSCILLFTFIMLKMFLLFIVLPLLPSYHLPDVSAVIRT